MGVLFQSLTNFIYFYLANIRRCFPLSDSLGSRKRAVFRPPSRLESMKGEYFWLWSVLDSKKRVIFALSSILGGQVGKLFLLSSEDIVSSKH